MAAHEFGMKVYDTAWYSRFGMDYSDLASWLQAHGLTFVYTVNQYLPPPHSPTAVELTAEQAARLATFADDRFRSALDTAGIGYWGTASFFYDPPVWDTRPEARPVNRFGEPMPPQGWYRGCCPTDDWLVAEKIRQIVACVTHLGPDGILLTFMRFPGFWEDVLPGMAWGDIPQGCFCPRCLQRFARESRVSLPAHASAGETAARIVANHLPEWTAWKCRVIAGVVEQVRLAITKIKPDIKLALNTLPFGRDDHGDAARTVYGQDIEALSPFIDYFEVMAYHQIVKQPVPWIGQRADEVKARTGKRVVATIQGQALYTDGMYASAGREPELGSDEFAAALAHVRQSQADGAVVFALTDFLTHEAAGRLEYGEHLRAFRRD